MGGALDPPDGELVSLEYRDGCARVAQVPSPNRLVDTSGAQQEFAILVPIAGEYFELMGMDGESGATIIGVPDFHGVIPAGRSELVGVTRVPLHAVDAFAVLLERRDRSTLVGMVQLDRL